MTTEDGNGVRMTDEALPALMLEWLSRDAARLQAFCAASGYGPATMLADAGSPALLQAVFEYLMADEALLLQFCADTNTPPEHCSRLWQRQNRWMNGT